MFLPSVCEWIGECDKCWKAPRAVSRLQKLAIEMQICYHLVEPWLKSTLEEILENQRCLRSPGCHVLHSHQTKAPFNIYGSTWRLRRPGFLSHRKKHHELCHIMLENMNHRFITILLSPCSPSAWRRKNWDFHGHLSKVQLFSWTDRQFNNKKKVLNSKHYFASMSQNFLSYCNTLCINLEQARLV